MCYCYSPPRYLWNLREVYLEKIKRKSRLLYSLALWETNRLRRFDLNSAKSVDAFIPISKAVADRVRTYYHVEPAEVIYPPVEISQCKPAAHREDFYLVVSELTYYKRIDLVVDACTKLKRPVKIVGTGPELETLKKSSGSSVEFCGYKTDIEVKELMGKCRAFLFPGEEDFGITPVEAQASGAPVIAFARGGALETVVEGKTGLFFKEQTVECLTDTLRIFENMPSLSIDDMKTNSFRFDRSVFDKKFSDFLTEFSKVNP